MHFTPATRSSSDTAFSSEIRIPHLDVHGIYHGKCIFRYLYLGMYPEILKSQVRGYLLSHTRHIWKISSYRSIMTSGVNQRRFNSLLPFTDREPEALNRLDDLPNNRKVNWQNWNENLGLQFFTTPCSFTAIVDVPRSHSWAFPGKQRAFAMPELNTNQIILRFLHLFNSNKKVQS